jgi:hypothetical protein
LSLNIEPRILAAALSETVEALRRKRDQGTFKPLKDHRYLQSVIETVSASAAISQPVSCSLNEPAPTGKRAQAIAALAEWGRGDWLRRLIGDGLSALLTLGLDGTPGADVICRTADVWHHVMAGSCSAETVDSQRVKAAFSGLLKAVEKWPEPKAIWAHMPRRPQQELLPEAPRSEQDCQTALNSLREMRQRIIGGMGLPQTEKIDEEARRRQLREQAQTLRDQPGEK